MAQNTGLSLAIFRRNALARWGVLLQPWRSIGAVRCYAVALVGASVMTCGCCVMGVSQKYGPYFQLRLRLFDRVEVLWRDGP